MLGAAARIAWVCGIIFFCWLMIGLTLPYLSFKSDVDFLLTKQKIIHIKLWRYAFYTHVLFSIFSLAAGLTQFSPYLLRHYPRLHRVMGYVYVVDVLCLAGPSGLIMAFYANGTVVSQTSFVLLSGLWIGFTAMGLITALRKSFRLHEAWMIRSYALTLSAITLRLLAFMLPHAIHLEAKTAYALIAWLSWTINLALAELVVRVRKLTA